MDLPKKNFIIGLTLLANCYFVEAIGLCKFANRFTKKGSDCSSGFPVSFNGSCYKFVDPGQGADRSTAQSACEHDSSHLVFIESKEENDFLMKEISHGKRYWIGLFSPQRYLFWENGNRVTYVNIDRDNQETFNDGVVCYKMSNTEGRYWFDNNCTDQLGFICEQKVLECPYETFDHFGNSCYKFFSDSPASRTTAQLKCEEDSAYLVSIESKEENDFLIGRAQNDTEYWIGLHDRPQLFWDDGNQVTFTNMDAVAEETFDERSGCYRMEKGGKRFWADNQCDYNIRYICEYEDTECSPDYFKSFNGSCYKFADSLHFQKLNRYDAHLECHGDSAHLVFIETKEENDFLVNETSDGKNYWIGLFSPKRHLFWDSDNQGTFVNLDPFNEDTFSYGTGCYKMSTTDGRYWRGNSCREELAFICEYEGSECPYDTMDHFYNSCYEFVSSSPASRISAQLKCEADSSHLVFIESKEENDFLINRAQNGTEYWIGLHDLPQLFWDNGNQATYTSIDIGQDGTFDGRTDCYQMSDYDAWFDWRCDDNSGYICEYECDYI